MTDLSRSPYRPDVEAVSHFRTALERDLEWMESHTDKLDGDMRAGWEKAIRMIRYRTLGSESGCVITAFDRRGPEILEGL